MPEGGDKWMSERELDQKNPQNFSSTLNFMSPIFSDMGLMKYSG